MALSVTASASGVIDGIVTLTASASGGTEPYSFSWVVVRKPEGSKVEAFDYFRINGLRADGFPSSVELLWNERWLSYDWNGEGVHASIAIMKQCVRLFLNNLGTKSSLKAHTWRNVRLPSSEWEVGHSGDGDRWTFEGVEFVPKAFTQPTTSIGYSRTVDFLFPSIPLKGTLISEQPTYVGTFTAENGEDFEVMIPNLLVGRPQIRISGKDISASFVALDADWRGLHRDGGLMPLS